MRFISVHCHRNAVHLRYFFRYLAKLKQFETRRKNHFTSMTGLAGYVWLLLANFLDIFCLDIFTATKFYEVFSGK
jgi:hypothetical protein